MPGTTRSRRAKKPEADVEQPMPDENAADTAQDAPEAAEEPIDVYRPVTAEKPSGVTPQVR